MAKEYKTIKTQITLPYEIAYGATWTRFFEGFKERKIYGTECPQCKRILVPGRAFCPRCFVDTGEWVELSQEGTLVSWNYVNYRYFGMPTEPPYVGGLIRLDGADVGFLHLIGGFGLSDFEEVKKKVKSGMRVRAAWNEERQGNIMDIKYFEPI